jgi:enoyl-[acyl-carrier protein] reductase I
MPSWRLLSANTANGPGDAFSNNTCIKESSISTLENKKGLIVGIANEHSIAYGCARHFRAAGAELAVTYVNAKAEPYVRPLATSLGSDIVLPCDVTVHGQLEAVFAAIVKRWGRLDFALHSIAYARAEDLHGRIIDCSADGFAFAMQVSVHSFLRLAKLAEPLMTSGGCLLAMSYYGADKVVAHYNVMGPVKAALEAAVRYMAVELGPKHIRVNALSPGPVATRAASGIEHFDELLERAAKEAPEHKLITIDDVGALAAFLVSDEAKAITGNISYVDAGYHVLG